MNKITQYQRVFNQFDENQDGRISPPELQQCVSIGFRDNNFTLQQAESAIALLDSDGDGLISFDGFVKFIERGEEEEEEKIDVLEEAFKMYYDDDRSGKFGDRGADNDYFVTAKSLKRRLSKLRVKKSDEECLMMIAQFDINGDGVLNFDEFLAIMS